MKIGCRFNQLSLKECLFTIDNHEKYTDFNTLGLYRSILENQRLTLEEKIELREYAHLFFRKFFDFLQIKDPHTYLEVNALGKQLTEADRHQAWAAIRTYQNEVLAAKRIKHRNFGQYAKHNCPYPDCPYNGVMIRQGSPLAGTTWLMMRGRNGLSRERSCQRRSDRKQQRSIIRRMLETE